jgi:uncharacterized protein (TIGR03067 family)
MIRRLHVLAVGLSLLLAPAARADDSKDMQGTWVVVSSERDGVTGDNPDDKLVVKGDKIMIMRSSTNREDPVTFKLDAAQKPKHLNLTTPGRQSIKGIYELQGDNLKICFGKPGSERPADFKTKENSGFMCVTLKRAK